MLVRKNSVARMAVLRLRKFAEPLEPNRLPAAGRTAAKRRPHVGALAVLQEHQHDDRDGHDDVNDPD